MFRKYLKLIKVNNNINLNMELYLFLFRTISIKRYFIVWNIAQNMNT